MIFKKILAIVQLESLVKHVENFVKLSKENLVGRV
jgi:hypothetical protein